MTSRVWAAVALAVAASPALGAAPGGRQAGPRWLEDYGQARRVAKEGGRPLFVVFRCEH
jgi:hypothetical protein